MKAIRIHRFGPPDVIQVDEVEPPRPGADEVVVKVRVAGVGPWDSWIRAGRSVLEQPLPLTLGSDLSGTLVAVGADAGPLERGEEVFGVTNARFTGAYAEYAVAKGSMVARKPRKVSHRDAAAVPVVAVTAFQMLFDHARVGAGQRVLVHGAGGSVGSCAVQLARAAGAYVVGTEMSTRGAEYVASLGAQQVIDTSAVRFEEVVEPVDAVVDAVGGDLQARSFAVLKKGGVLVSSVSRPDALDASRAGVRATFMLVDMKSGVLAQIGERMETGELVTRIGTVLPLLEARAAHEMLEGLRAREPGKILLTVSEP
jgi:NADPH:quinone reductase-like Zn-dependent oxidoreductase